MFEFFKNEGYSHTETICQNKSKWMKGLKDNIPLSKLSIPGTHDTMSLGWGGDIAQNQSKSLINQLTCGIRFLDIRLGAFPNSKHLLYSYHGFIYLHSNFFEILNIVTYFLNNNPTETILMRIRQEHTEESAEIFMSLIEKFLNNPQYSQYFYKNIKNKNPVLGQLRGRILIIQNFTGFLKGLDYKKDFDIQDNYYLRTNWDLYSKWEKIKTHFLKANESFLKKKNKSFVNYLSGSGGSFPYFVASGRSSTLANAPRLAIGLTEPFFSGYYPDFPRVNWFWGIFATIAFEGTNNLAKA
ncbi:MAG: phosphatidylinositol-specific phospholipase C domain-containing protein, partial [Sarcina sp.]